MMDIERTRKFVDQCWADEIVPTLVDYIRIPNKSPFFDPDWAAHGYMDEAVQLFERWARARLANVTGATLEVVRLPGRTPVIVIDLPGADRRHRAALWASRQAAGDDRLGRRVRPVDPSSRRRQALWARRRGRRLCDVRGAERPAGAARPVGPARPLRHPDRGLRGVRQLRPAILCRPPCREARQSIAGDLSRFGLWQLRSAVADDLAARSGLGHVDSAGSSRRACIRATPRVSFLRAFGFSVVCCRGSRTRKPERSVRRSSTLRFRPSG